MTVPINSILSTTFTAHELFSHYTGHIYDDAKLVNFEPQDIINLI